MTANNGNSNNNITRNPHTIFLKPVGEDEVLKLIMTLKNTSASGYDDITTKILKLIASLISRPLSHIINLSLADGFFPDELKLTVIKPLHKKNNLSDPNNYRPIALIPIISKIFVNV